MFQLPVFLTLEELQHSIRQETQNQKIFSFRAFDPDLQLPQTFHDIELERISDYILVSQPHAFTLAWQGLSSSIYIKMSPEFVGRTCGLCGNFNADIQDDLKTSYGECSVTGDMYFKSFDGRIYTFPATCQYVLAKSRNTGQFIVTIQNTPCGPVRLSHNGEVYMANQIRVSLPYSDEMFQIQELSSMFIQVRTVHGLQLHYNWKEFQLYLQLGKMWRDNTVGLCGTFNGNIQDDFLAPSGMVESSPNLFGNAWRVSSACMPRPSLLQLDPCDTHQQAVSYAVEKCDIMMQEIFAVCHEYVSPLAFHLQCRADVCRCGTPCLCSALAHYTRTCRKHNVIIEFRAHVPECALTCPPTMEYGVCVSSCDRHCLSLSLPQFCGDECEEGCVCPQGTYYSMHTQTCVERSECPCFFLGADYSPGDVILTSSEIQLLKHGDECYEPVACPCLWKGKKYYPGDKVSSPCHQCVCQHGSFQCDFHACASMCTVYGDGHYRTFDGLLFDFVGECKVYLLKSSDDTTLSVAAENVDCFESGSMCRTSLYISVGHSIIVFHDESGNPVDVTSYYMNCLVDACSCSRGGDCDCFCTSLATYAHSCCQQGIPIDWRSPSLCHSSLVSIEAADRPNYFLFTEHSGQLKLRKWEDNTEFFEAATFILHKDTWITGFVSVESLVLPGYFLHSMLYKLRLLKYNHSPRYRRATLFKLAGSTADLSLSPQCQWRYESCTSPCFRTCSDPLALSCVPILKVEGCLPRCPAHMVLDEMTHRCVYLEDCIKPPVTLAEVSSTLTAITSYPLATKTVYTIAETEALKTTIRHTVSSTLERSTTESTTVVIDNSTQLSTLSTTSTISDESIKTSSSHPMSIPSTARTVKLPTSTVFSPIDTITSSLSISKNSSVGPIIDSTNTSTKLLARLSTHASTPPTFTTNGTTETKSTGTVPASFTAEYFTFIKSLALDLSTSTTTEHPSVSGPLKTTYYRPPTVTPRYFTEFITAGNAVSPLKTTTVSGTRNPLIVHTKKDSIPTSLVVIKTSTTQKPKETTKTMSFVTEYPMSKDPMTTKTISDIFNTTTQTKPSLASVDAAVETTKSTTFQPISMLYTTRTSWSSSFSPVDESHTTTSWGMSQTTAKTSSTESTSPNLFESTTEPVVPTITKSLPVPSLVTLTVGLPPTTAHVSSTLSPSHIFYTQMTTPIIPTVTNGTVAKARTTSSTDLHLSSILNSSTSAYLSEKIVYKTQPSTSASTLADKLSIKTTSHGQTPVITMFNYSPTPFHQTQVTGSSGTSRTTEPRSSKRETVFTTVRSGAIYSKVETTPLFPRTDKSVLATDKSLQQSLQLLQQATPRTTSYTEKAITPKIIVTVSSTIHKTSKNTMTTHILPLIVTEKSKIMTFTEKMRDTTLFSEREKSASQSSSSSPLTFSTIISTKALINKTENRTAVGPTATSVSTSTSTNTLMAPHNTTTASARPLSLTMSPSDLRLMDKITSATHITKEVLPSSDRSQTSSELLISTNPYMTQTKQWIAPADEFFHLTPSVLSTSAKDVSPIKTCTPPYSLVVDECTKLICVNGQLVLFNKSQSCPYETKPPNCGLLGFAVLVNREKCCPKWKCPCRCSVFPDINIVTFDGNSVALYKAAAYVLTQLMNETVTILVQECNSSDNKLVWNFSHLCLASLNITHDSNQVLINRLQRQVYVNSRYAKPRFKKYGFEVLDTGNMYLVLTPAGRKIQWFHSTGMMVIDTENNANRVSTMGLCGCCDGNPLNDLILPNGTAVAYDEDPAVFIDSWQISNTTNYVGRGRRRKVNCSTSDCSDCLNMLNNFTFATCHSYVPPATFCELWVRDADYVSNPCVALAAYVASCHKFNICIEWRSQDYCPFVCPGTLQYQACLPACNAPSCPNKEFDYNVQCSGMSEGCGCPEGTLLHRPYSTICISPVKCACTDSFGAPRALGEVWKSSVDGCCMYRCESDGIVPVEFECNDVPQPVCTRAGEISINLADDNSCCIQKVCVCEPSRCSVITCPIGMVAVSTTISAQCCPTHECQCACEKITRPKCAKPGKSWVSDCMRYECTDTQSGPVLVSYSYSCPPFNETECIKVPLPLGMRPQWELLRISREGPFKEDDSAEQTPLGAGRKEDGKSCQKVTVRMTIRKNDCRSNRPVNIVSCDGKCPSASIYNYNINTYARFCKCCREMGLQQRSVQLYCSGNATWVNYSIQEPTDCSCQWS
ncbi:Otogelin [Bagarius yarrelli]|uniref:Otogelin n=1 Tax=Bagarius yarrelli TaxID=175774 RepID=A0A556V7E8_BAGYA|nr:Otogelin [Bagarius yarrelli]